MISLGSELPSNPCSRAGCVRAATRLIRWRNPKIHTGDRYKTWAACDEHVEYLRDFLGARNFPLQVVALDGSDATGSVGHKADR